MNNIKAKVFVITNNYQFFYKLNRALKRLKIKFKILNFKDHLPKTNSNKRALILTTQSEVEKLYETKKSYIILAYNKKEDFEKYIFDLIKIYNCGPEIHSKVLFSIDPGDTIGLAVFLDGNFFYSQNFYDIESLFKNIQNCVLKIEEEGQNVEQIEVREKSRIDTLDLIFKVGRGLPLTLELINTIYETFSHKDLKVYLVNESKSSKIKFHRFFDDFSKHEISALLLAIRKGIKVAQNNFREILKEKKIDRELKEEIEKELADITFQNEHRALLKKIINDLVQGNISIDKAFKLIEHKKAIASLQ